MRFSELSAQGRSSRQQRLQTEINTASAVGQTLMMGGFAGALATLTYGFGMWMVTIPIGCAMALIIVVPFVLYARSCGLRRVVLALTPSLIFAMASGFQTNVFITLGGILILAIGGVLVQCMVDQRR